MADETPEEKPKRRRARKTPPESEGAPAVEAADAEVTEDVEDDSVTRAASTAGSTSSEDSVDEVEPTAADEAAEDAAADVVLEAEDEIDADSEEAAEEKPKRRAPGWRRAAAEPAAKEAPAKPAPTRRRAAARDPNLPPPVVRAQAKYVRSSARKARLVCDHIRGKSVGEARAILAHTPRAVARDWSKLLESAIANAENNHELVGDDLYVKAIHADEGPTIKRFRPRAMGRATKIRKRTSHLTILLTPKD